MDINEETIRNHCKRMAAQIIHDTMECAEPRNEHDWFAACRIIDANPGIVKSAIRMIEDHRRHVNRDADPNHYGTFEYVFRRTLWENLQRPRERLEDHPPFGKITFY